MPGDGHAGCGKRPGETGRSKDRNRAPGRFHHRLFSHITMNWRGRPLTSHEIIVQAIAVRCPEPSGQSIQ